jgi:O-antigen/teichoic acid export membrane protein
VPEKTTGKMMTRLMPKLNRTLNNTVLRNTIWLLLGYGLRMGLQAAAFILIARSLGVNSFGALAASLAAVNLIAPLVDYGAYNLVVRDIVAGIPASRAVGVGLATTSLTLPIGMLALLIGQLVFLPALHSWLVIAIGFATFLGNRSVLLSNGVHVAHGMAWRNTLLEGFNGLTFFLAACLLVVFKGGLGFWAVALLCQSLLVASVVFTVIVRTWGALSWSWPEVKARLRDGIHFAVNGAATSAYSDFDKTALARLTTLETVGVFTAGHRVVVLSAVPLAAFLNSIYPKFFAAGQRSFAEVRAFAWRIVPFTMAYGLAVVAFIWFLAPELSSWFGDGFAQSAEVMRWLSVIVLLQALQLPFAETLTGAGMQAIRTRIQVGALVVNVVLNLVLIPMYGWKGAVIASICGQTTNVLALFMMVNLQKNRV